MLVTEGIHFSTPVVLAQKRSRASTRQPKRRGWGGRNGGREGHVTGDKRNNSSPSAQVGGFGEACC